MARRILLHAILIQFCVLFSKIDAVSYIKKPGYPQNEELGSQLNDIHPDRTAFHFQPSTNWLNDPNGPMYYNGLYHLFYQYNPYGPLWGNLAWGHSISTDLVNWEALDVALDRTEPFDINGCWSGSVSFVAGKPVILYTGIDDKQRNVQNIAFPKNASDVLLREWDKPGYNPIMLPVGDIDPDNFRDPTTAWFGQDGYWRAAVGANLEGRADVLIYKSQDFTSWKKNEFPLHRSQSSGMWECPDFFPVSLSSKDGLDPSVNTGNIKHLLKVGLMKTLQDYYLLGKYDENKDAFVPDEGYEDDYRTWPMIDYGHLYASKSFFDGKKNRRILWAWVNESDSEADDVKKGWSGIQAFPRAIWLDTDGKHLIQWPIEEIKSLRKQHIVKLHDFGLQSGVRHEISGILTSQADIELEFELQSLDGAELFDNSFLLDPSKLCNEIGPFNKGEIGPFGLFVLASNVNDQQEYTAIYFRIYKSSDKYMTLMCSDLRSSSLREGVYKPAYGAFVGVDISKDKRIPLRTLIDHSVVESYAGGGRTCMTLRVYPKHVLTGQTSRLYVFNHGSQEVKIKGLNAWEMDKARVNIENDDFISRDFI